MRCLAALCEDGQLLVDVFVNYDCDLEGANLFERLVTALVRIAQARVVLHTTSGSPSPLGDLIRKDRKSDKIKSVCSHCN